MSKKVSDWAKWNEIKNYQSALNAGIDAVILKVINAQNKPDGKFYDHVSGCNSVGLPIIGGYTYSYADTVYKAKEAAEAFVRVGAPKGIKVMWLDLEDKSIMNLRRKIIDIINVYRQAAADAGMGFGIYMGASFYNPCLKTYASEIVDIPIWWARYPFTKNYAPTMPEPDTKYLPTGIDIAGWQYTSKGVIPGASGYVDLSVWYKDAPEQNTDMEITVERNPFTEPESNVKLGKLGNDANWVLWYLWRFGKLVDEEGAPDIRFIDGNIGVDDVVKIKEVQKLLGLDADGIVGKITRSVWKKIC